MDDKRRIRRLRQRALIIAGKADQVNLLAFQRFHPVQRRTAASGFGNNPDRIKFGGVLLLEDFVIRPQRQAGIHPGYQKFIVNILGDQLRKAAAVNQNAVMLQAFQQRSYPLRRLNAHIIDVVGHIEFGHGDIEFNKIDQLQPAAEFQLLRQAYQRRRIAITVLRHGADPFANALLRIVLNKTQHGHFRLA